MANDHNLKNPAVKVTITHPKLDGKQNFDSLTQAAAFISNELLPALDPTGNYERQFVHQSLLNFLLRTKLTLTGEHPLAGLTVSPRQLIISSIQHSDNPTSQHTGNPSIQHSDNPTSQHTGNPSYQQSIIPTDQQSTNPAILHSYIPTVQTEGLSESRDTIPLDSEESDPLKEFHRVFQGS